MPYAVVMVFAIVMALFEWWQWFSNSPPSPIIYSAIALLAILIVIWKVRAARIKIKRLNLGYQGEKVVAQTLSGLHEDGAQIFHDVPAEVPGKRFNLDHVIVHMSGLYVVETKTVSKPERGKSELVFNGETVLKNGIAFDRNPIEQVRANKKWLSELLENSTGRHFPIKAVVIYPGWFIRSTREGNYSDEWVLNEKAFIAYFRKQPERMKFEDVALAADRIRIHIENYNG